MHPPYTFTEIYYLQSSFWLNWSLPCYRCLDFWSWSNASLFRVCCLLQIICVISELTSSINTAGIKIYELFELIELFEDWEHTEILTSKFVTALITKWITLCSMGFLKFNTQLIKNFLLLKNIIMNQHHNN